jgi:hypothetical protein
VRKCVDVGEVVDRHDLEVGAARGASYVNGAEEVSADTPETVYAHPDHHDVSSTLAVGWRIVRTPSRV